MNFKELKSVKDLNIQEVGSVYETVASNIKEEERSGYLIDDEMLENDTPIIFADLNDLIDETDYECCDFDDSIFYEFIEDLLKTSEHYLCIDYGANWRGAIGYGIFDNKEKCFVRNYDCSQFVIGATIGGKALSIRESSHDCPMGAEILIIRLTDKEYNMLQNKEFNDIIEFGNGIRENIKYFINN